MNLYPDAERVLILEHHPMGPRPRSALLGLLAAGLGVAGMVARTGRDMLEAAFQANPTPSFGQRYGSNPKPYNGGVPSGAAALKRAARRRRNVRARAPK